MKVLQTVLVSIISSVSALCLVAFFQAYKSDHERVRRPVPLIELLARPASFDGKEITVSGYMALEGEDSLLYLYKTDYDIGRLDNSILLLLANTPVSLEDRNRLNYHYVVVRGRCRATSQWALVTLDNISSIKLQERRRPVAPEQQLPEG